MKSLWNFPSGFKWIRFVLVKQVFQPNFYSRRPNYYREQDNGIIFSPHSLNLTRGAIILLTYVHCVVHLNYVCEALWVMEFP